MFGAREHRESGPTNEVVSTGGEAVFSVAVVDPEDYSYQWKFDGTNLPSVPIISTVAVTSPANITSCVAVDKSGNVIFYAYGMYVIQELATNVVITTVAGNGARRIFRRWRRNLLTNASMGAISGIAADGSGNLFIEDSSSSTVRESGRGAASSRPSRGMERVGILVMAARLPMRNSLDRRAWLRMPQATCTFRIPAITCIRKVDTMGVITTFAGNGNNGFRGDGGPASKAELGGLTGVAVDTYGGCVHF